MDIDKERRRQSIKVIVSEAIMVIAMVATVILLAFIVSGYWLNSDFKVERQGMLQISSAPSGASLIVDDETPSWFQRTNTSKILSATEHEIRLEKEGYDTWSRKINISEGLLYRIHYPRLFLLERESEKVFDATKFNFATISPNNKLALLIGDTTEWTLLNLDNETMKPEKLNIAGIFSNTTLTETEDEPETATGSGAENAAETKLGVFTGKILVAEWSKNNEHILFKVENEAEEASAVEWVLLDVVNLKNSINLTREFGVNFHRVKIFDNSASTLLALEGNNLKKIDARNKTISANLVKDVVDFDHYDSKIVFSAKTETSTSENAPAAEPYYLGTFQLGNNKIEELAKMRHAKSVVIFQFYDDKYIATLFDKQLTLHREDDFSEVSNFELGFTPETLKVGHQGEYLMMTAGKSIATLDMENKTLREWAIDGRQFGWIDGDILYAVKNGELFVYDFDGQNRRMLAKNVSEHFPVTITNDKWLYYFSDGSLIREIIMK